MKITASEIRARRTEFKELHRSGCFVIPNPWDAGSAKLLESIGFKALATTSSGHAWSLGQPDGSQTREEIVAHVAEMVEATALPVNADFGNGFGADAEAVAESVRMLVATGAAGISIEDSTGNADNPLFHLETAVERMRVSRAAIDELGGEVLLVGRAENFLFDEPDIEDTVRRLKAYQEAGADCLYAPGVKHPDQISRLVREIAPAPLNLLVSSPSALTVEQIQELGVRRISVGGALARVAIGSFIRAASELMDSGRFDRLGEGTPGWDLDAFFSGGKAAWQEKPPR